MRDCPFSTDHWVDLVAALEGPVLPLVDHLAECSRCREELASLESLREWLRAEDVLPVGWVDRVMAQLDRRVPMGAPHGRRAGWVRVVAGAVPTAGLVGVVGGVVSTAGSLSGTLGPAAPGYAPTAVGLLAAVAFVFWAVLQAAVRRDVPSSLPHPT